MAWIRLLVEGEDILVTPEALKQIKSQILKQVGHLTLIELADYAGALGLNVGQLSTILKGLGK